MGMEDETNPRTPKILTHRGVHSIEINVVISVIYSIEDRIGDIRSFMTSADHRISAVAGSF